MNCLNKNLEYLKIYKKPLYIKINEILEKKIYDFSKFKIVKTRDGLNTLEIDYNQKKIRLNSLYYPKKEAKVWSNKLNFNNLNVSVIMFGLANGFFAEEILNKMKEDGIAVFFEPDYSLFLFCLCHFDMFRILSDNRVDLYISGINDDKFYSFIQNNINAIMIPTQIVCSYPKLEDIYLEEADEFMRVIREKYYLEIAVSFALKDEYKSGIRNTIKNLHFIKNSNYYVELNGKISDNVPFIIVSAGPSLNKNVNELKKAEGKAVILATDSSVKFLIENDISFDAIITTDATKDECCLEDKRCLMLPVFAGIKSKNEILELNKGKKIWLVSSKFMCRLYQKYHLEYYEWNNGGSVATEAFNLVKSLGAKVIILVGQDLAFSKDDTHVGGKKDIENYGERDIKYVEDVNGKLIKSRSDWVRYLDWFNSEIEKLKGKIEVVDATEGGAKIKGTKIMRLSNAIDEYCNSKIDFSKILSDILPTFDEKTYDMIVNDIYNMKDELEDIKEAAYYGIELSDKMLSVIQNNYIDENKSRFCVERIKKINEFIEKQLVYTIISDYTETKLKGIMKVNCFSKNCIDDVIRSFELSRNAFEAFIESVDYTYPILSEELEKLD